MENCLTLIDFFSPQDCGKSAQHWWCDQSVAQYRPSGRPGYKKIHLNIYTFVILTQYTFTLCSKWQCSWNESSSNLVSNPISRWFLICPPVTRWSMPFPVRTRYSFDFSSLDQVCFWFFQFGLLVFILKVFWSFEFSLQSLSEGGRSAANRPGDKTLFFSSQICCNRWGDPSPLRTKLSSRWLIWK